MERKDISRFKFKFYWSRKNFASKLQRDYLKIIFKTNLLVENSHTKKTPNEQI